MIQAKEDDVGDHWSVRKSGKKNRRSAGPPPNTAAPKVHVKVAVADSDLRAAALLLKPAILYADTVTIYSPAATMVSAIQQLGRVTDPRQQMALTWSLIEGVPHLRDQVDLDESTLEQLATVMSLDRRELKRIARSTGATDQLDSFTAALDGMGAVWAEGIPQAIEAVKSSLGAEDLLVAVDRGAVKVADLLTAGPTPLVVESLRVATGSSAQQPLDDLVEVFVAKLIEVVEEPRTFPLFDATSSGLLRSIEGLLDASPPALSARSKEVAAAASFMGFLPNFAAMPMDEVLDLRKQLAKPLKRFRGAVARMSREFETRVTDESFVLEVEDAWRTQVEPALADIREAMAEHGLLREVASVALGDPRRLMAEAGGVVAAAHGDVISLSGLLTAGAAAGVPAVDVVGRAALARSRGRRAARQHAFYFLHRLSH